MDGRDGSSEVTKKPMSFLVTKIIITFVVL